MRGVSAAAALWMSAATASAADGPSDRVWLQPQGASPSFGWSVDIAGDRVIVGDAVSADGRPIAYVFALRAGEWTVEGRLAARPSTLPLGMTYRPLVAITAEVAAVAETTTGALFVYLRGPDGWQPMPGPALGPGQLLGVSADGRDVAVLIGEGNPTDPVGPGGPPHRIEVYHASEDGLVRSASVETSYLRWPSIDLRGDRLAAGIAGGVAVWTRGRDGWQRTAGPEGPAIAEFGMNVAWSGPDLVVSAPFAMVGGARLGELSIWRPGAAGWSRDWASRGDPDGLGGPMMAASAPSLGADGGWAVVGLHHDTDRPMHGGYALARRGPAGWRLVEHHRDESRTHLGFSAALDASVGARFVVGSPSFSEAPGGALVAW